MSLPPQDEFTVASFPSARVALWQPENASIWNLIFTPVFGAWIHAQNWSALGEEKRARESMNWCIVFLYLLVWGSTALPIDPLIISSWFVNSIWHLKISKLQEHYVADRNGGDCVRRNWERPALVATILLLLAAAHFFAVAPCLP